MDGKFYVYTALPFGLSISPLVYTKFMRHVVMFIRNPKFADNSWFYFKSLPAKIVKKGFRSLIYLDDLLVLMRKNAFATRKV